jgi:hypothetical protein
MCTIQKSNVALLVACGVLELAVEHGRGTGSVELFYAPSCQSTLVKTVQEALELEERQWMQRREKVSLTVKTCWRMSASVVLQACLSAGAAEAPVKTAADKKCTWSRFWGGLWMPWGLNGEETHFQKVTQWIKKNEREQGREEHIAYWIIDLGVRADDAVITPFQSLRGAKIFEYDDQVSFGATAIRQCCWYWPCRYRRIYVLINPEPPTRATCIAVPAPHIVIHYVYDGWSSVMFAVLFLYDPELS